MSATRDLSMADIDTQIQQAQLYAQVPTSLPPLNGVGVGPPDRTTSQYPTERQGTVYKPEPPTQIQNPYTLAPLVPGGAGIAPPPPPSKQGGQQGGQQPQDQRTVAENLRLQRLRIALQAGQVARDLGGFFQRQNRNLGSIPTPGGIWVPFWILVGLYLILIPANGHTRLNWLWLSIIGSASIGGIGLVSGGTGKGSKGLTTTLPPTPSPIPPGSSGSPFVPLASFGQSSLSPAISLDYMSGINGTGFNGI